MTFTRSSPPSKNIEGRSSNGGSLVFLGGSLVVAYGIPTTTKECRRGKCLFLTNLAKDCLIDVSAVFDESGRF